MGEDARQEHQIETFVLVGQSVVDNPNGSAGVVVRVIKSILQCEQKFEI